MRLFKRPTGAARTGRGPSELAALLREGEEMVAHLAEAHSGWGLGTADRWDLDQATGLLTWTFPDRTATAPAQILGTHNAAAGSWLWAWANPSILPELSRDSRTVRDWAQHRGHTALTEPKVDADQEHAATLAALALRITRAGGFYRGTGAAAVPYLTFGTVTLTRRDEPPTTFRVATDD
ncbi:DUF6882 domain-containing protein [Kitasatospora paracochleata]|uniref:Uncharacterized protein n=1 Tax=Kitasatospora paracochleata TaxID=58354 RepID=A0ABT1J1G0_9ACTN|nr:DUF6882 domain-containing protein [Kitasatospora paracochleata]MCP2311256.1 hypothetical protein [Kitasatospora paracochleata]